MNKDDIMQILPHRDGMLLIDEVTLQDDFALGKKTIRPEEWFLQGHFPGKPVVPGVVLCEILAQSACVLLAGKTTSTCTPYLTGLEHVRFKSPVQPGDTLHTRCSIVKSKGNFYWAKGEGCVDGKLCVQAEFSFMITEN